MGTDVASRASSRTSPHSSPRTSSEDQGRRIGFSDRRSLPRLKRLIDWLTTTVPPAIRRVVSFFERFGHAPRAAAVIGTFVAGFQAFAKIKAIIEAASRMVALNATRR